MSRVLCPLLVVLFMVRPVLAQRDAQVPDPDPEIERRTFQVADGLEVTLFAADPMLAKPIQMNFDARGRLWIASSETYPHIRPGEVANDKILVLEDSDGDGRADRTTVFLGGLLIPTGIEPGDGGAYVANSTELMHVEETAEGKAGKVRVLLSGFGTEDTHHILHSFRWGPDGRLYMNQSIYIHSHVETPHGPRRLNAGGIWAFRPSTHRLDVFARGWINSWGHAFDRYGQSFVTDGAGGEGVNWCLPGGYYPTAIGPHSQRILHGLNPGHPKYCGAEIISGRHFPEDWHGDLITNDFRGHRVVRFKLREDGAGFAALPMPDVIRSHHPAFRPVDVKIGPDGALYVADWYNPIIQHGEVDFRDPRRDKTHGRIWRVTFKGRPLVTRPKLVDASTPELIFLLKAPEMWTRQMARRVLTERGPAAVRPALEQSAAALDDQKEEDRHTLLELLWLQQSLGLPPTLTERLVTSPEAGLRAAAIRAAADHPDTAKKLALGARCVCDEHPRVRLEAVRMLASVPSAVAAATAAEVLDRPLDLWLDYAVWLTLRELEPHWLPQLRRGEIPFRQIPHLVFALRAVDAQGVAPLVTELLKSGRAAQGGWEIDLWELLAGVGNSEQLTLVLQKAAADPAARPRLLSALAKASQQRRIKPAGSLTGTLEWLRSSDEMTRIEAARLVGSWQLTEGLEHLLHQAKSDPSLTARQNAVRALAEFRGPNIIVTLDELARNNHPAEVKRAAITAMIQRQPELAAQRTVAWIQTGASDRDVAELIAEFVRQRGAADVLARALHDKKLPEDSAKIAVRSAQAGGPQAQTLIDALKRAGNLQTARRLLTPQEKEALLEEVRQKGDPARGEMIYRRADLACTKCHAIGGAGGLAGPDLISLGASAPLDYILDSLLEPNKQVKENYHSLQVETQSGQRLSGVKVGETATELILRDGEDREIRILRSEIDEQRVGGSIMPEGLTDGLTRNELVDLIRFLSELGKVGGRFVLGPESIVRRWRVLEPTADAFHAIVRTGIQAPASDSRQWKWSPAYSTVSGILPPDELPKLEIKHGLEGSRELFSFLRCEFEVAAPGRIRVRLNGTEGLSAWWGSAAVPVKDEMEIDVKTGTHSLTLAVDWLRRPHGIRLELLQASARPARVRIVGGK